MNQTNWKPNPSDTVFSVGLILVLLAFFLINPETIPAGNGFGYDGVLYARMVAEIDQMIANGELSMYYAQRILPSVLVRFGLSSLGLPLDAAHIILGFRVLNFLSIAMSLVFWMAIARRIEITRTAYWIGFAGLFLIFPNAKQAFYYPVTTDTFAFMIGLALVWAHISERLVFLTAFTIIGSFAWQISGLVGTILILSTLVKGDPLRRPIAAFTPHAYKMANIVVLSGFTFLAILAGSVFLAGIDIGVLVNGVRLDYDPALRFLTNIPMLAIVSVFLVRLYMNVLSSGWRLSVGIKHLALVVLLVFSISIIPPLVMENISNPLLPPPGIAADGYVETLRDLLVSKVRDKFVLLPLLAHSVYYGPVFVLFVLLWREIASVTVRFGIGFVLVISLFAVVSVFAESRFSFLFWPFAVVAVSKAISTKILPRSILFLFAMASAYYSKIWLKINQAEWPLPDFSALFEWPKSVYFSHLGPFMNGESYIMQGAVVSVMFAVLFFSLRDKGSATVTDGNKV